MSHDPDAVFLLCTRPAFLPDPNDGSLYSLGGKNNEGLTVRGNKLITHYNLAPPLFTSHFSVQGKKYLKVILSHFNLQLWGCIDSIYYFRIAD